MRIQYTYHKYPNCPRATEYSQSVESTAAYAGVLIGPLSIGAVIAFFIYTFSFFGNYNWGEFLGTIAFTVAVASLDFYYFVIRLNNTQCRINVILAEDCSPNLPASVVQEYCRKLRKENRKNNAEEWKAFFLFFLLGLFGTVALIAAIKGVYFLCHNQGGLFLLLGGLAALGVLACFLWVSFRNTAPKAAGDPAPESVKAAFCRKCGARLLSDSVFCSKCGTKVR